MVCFALSPLTQLLHAVGMIDHHYVEHTFVLATIWLGCVGSSVSIAHRAPSPWERRWASPARFTTACSYLQLVPLAAVFVLWLRNAAPPLARSARFRRRVARDDAAHSVALGTVSALDVRVRAAVLVSLLHRRLHERRGRLHGMAAVHATQPRAARRACAAARRAARRTNRRRCRVPVRLVLGSRPDRRGAQPLRAGHANARGLPRRCSYYTWLLLAAPVLLAFYAYRVFRERDPARLYYAIAATFGLALLLDQFRLHYFGFFAMVTGGLLLLETCERAYVAPRSDVRRGVRGRRFRLSAGSPRAAVLVPRTRVATPSTGNILPLLLELQRQCAEDPGSRAREHRRRQRRAVSQRLQRHRQQLHSPPGGRAPHRRGLAAHAARPGRDTAHSART